MDICVGGDSRYPCSNSGLGLTLLLGPGKKIHFLKSHVEASAIRENNLQLLRLPEIFEVPSQEGTACTVGLIPALGLSSRGSRDHMGRQHKFGQSHWREMSSIWVIKEASSDDMAFVMCSEGRVGTFWAKREKHLLSTLVVVGMKSQSLWNFWWGVEM